LHYNIYKKINEVNIRLGYMSRTKNSIRNIKYATIGQILGLMISFFARMIFVRTLSAEYLGVNGLFTNILSMLSLAELGIGTAIVYSMYKPLAEKDGSKLKALMELYKKAYITIGIAIAFLGTVLTPFLGYIIKDMPDIPHIYVIYLMFVANSSISYFFSYNRSLIIADQKKYIETFYRYSFFFVLNIFQILILIFTQNYIYYLGLQLINTFVGNIFISRKANQLYPFLREKSIVNLNKEEKNTIVRNVKALMFHRIGGIVVLGTDNLLIAKFVGIVSVGLYSNYLLITNALNMIFGLIFESLTASIGNLGVTEAKEKQQVTFETINFAGFWIYSFASICLINLINPFINTWLGKEYLFPLHLVLLIVMSFYLTGMRASVLTFRNALGLYWYDRYKPIFEVGINLVASIFLANQIGIAGIFIGTIISTLTTCFWVEPYVVYKYGFGISALTYFMKYLFYTVFMIIVGAGTWIICGAFSGATLIGFMGKMMTCVIVPNVICVVVFWKTKEFQYLLKVFKPTFARCFGKQD